MYKRILFFQAGSCIGVEYIQHIKKIPGVDFLLAVDSDPYAAGLSIADKSVTVPRCDEKGFIETFQRLIDKYDIDYVFPFVEVGHKELMEVNANFGSDLKAGALCKDKYNFYKKCNSVGIDVPRTYLLRDFTDQLSFPLYAKPRRGDGSKNNYKIETQDQLDGLKLLYKDKLDDFMIQEFLSGQHWAADVVVEDGEIITIVTRKSLGKVYRVEVVQNDALQEYCKIVQKKLGIRKIFNVEFFETAPDYFVINEINSRIGGNCITRCLAGCDIVSYLITKDMNYLKEPARKAYSYCFQRVELSNKT